MMSQKRKGRPKKENQGDKLVLRVDLEKELQEDFFKIKDEHGFTNNTEVLRFCIKQIASSKIYIIPDEIWHRIEELVKDKRIREKYYITSANDFLQRALHSFLQKTNTDRSNLHDVEYRLALRDQDKQNLANILIILQMENPSIGVKMDELVERLLNVSRNKIEMYLNEFIRDNLIRKNQIEKETYYYAVDRSFLAEEPLEF
jgi:hypothetical protein